MKQYLMPSYGEIMKHALTCKAIGAEVCSSVWCEFVLVKVNMNQLGVILYLNMYVCKFEPIQHVFRQKAFCKESILFHSYTLFYSLQRGQGIIIAINYTHVFSGDPYKRLQAGNGGGYYSLALNAPDHKVEQVMKYVSSYVRQPNSQFTASYTGGYFSSRKLIGELSVVLAVALALLYFILAAQFESLVQPLIILLEMVVDVFFVLVALWIMGETINLMSMTGMVVMSGIVINDSILKIDTINHSRHMKVPSRGGLLRAIIEAGQRRLRPIMMTSLTTILAMLPFLSKGSMGAAIQFPMSLTLVVGMTFGTLVSLFFVPMLYYVIYRNRKR